MDRATFEKRLSFWIPSLVAVSCIASVIIAALYIILIAMPLFYFYGYVEGYYSLYSYRLYYSHSNQPISMPHTDYIRLVIATFYIASYALTGIALIAMVIVRWKPFAAPGLAYGVSSSLVVLYGLFNGYIRRAVELDIARFNHLIGDSLVYRTLAGTTTFEGVRIERTPIYLLIFSSPIPITLMAIAVIASGTAAGLAIYTFYKHNLTRDSKVSTTPKLKQFTVYTIIGLTAFTHMASIFIYYPSSIAVTPQPPPATLEPPPYTYTCTALTRTARGALAYTDFEVYPVPGWSTSGGTWSSVGGVAGAKGNVLQGSDDGRGLGGASHYYHNTDLSTYASLWTATKARWASGSGDQYYGISLMNSGRNRMFTVEIYTTGVTIGYLEIWSYNVVATGWRRHTSIAIPNYNRVNWYTIVVYYTVSGTTITITAYLYDASGSYVTTASATITHANVFRPAYIGVTVDGPTAYFDEFIISTSDPRGIYFTGFLSGMRVEVWDNLGYLVNSTAAPASSFYLNVRSDIVVGTGSDGRFVVRYPDNFLCLEYRVPVGDVILGGDSYSLITRSVAVMLGSNKTSAGVSIYIPGSSAFNTSARFLRVSASQTLYAKLSLDSISAPATLNLDIWLEGTTRSTSIAVRGGVPISTSTNVLQLNLGLNNFIILSGYFTATGQTAILYFRLELCTGLGGTGVCVYYPIMLDVKSP